MEALYFGLQTGLSKSTSSEHMDRLNIWVPYLDTTVLFEDARLSTNGKNPFAQICPLCLYKCHLLWHRRNLFQHGCHPCTRYSLSRWIVLQSVDSPIHLRGWPFPSSPTRIVSMQLKELLSGHPMPLAPPNFQTPSCYHLPPMSSWMGGYVHANRIILVIKDRYEGKDITYGHDK